MLFTELVLIHAHRDLLHMVRFADPEKAGPITGFVKLTQNNGSVGRG